MEKGYSNRRFMKASCGQLVFISLVFLIDEE